MYTLYIYFEIRVSIVLCFFGGIFIFSSFLLFYIKILLDEIKKLNIEIFIFVTYLLIIIILFHARKNCFH